MNNWIFTPAFCKAKMLEQSLEHLYKDPSTMKGFRHVILSNHYPVDKKNNCEAIRKLARRYDCIFIDSLYDRGLHLSVNNAMQIVGVRPGDFYAGSDPDDRPSPGAFHALRDVMQGDSSVAVAALNFWVIPWKMKEHGMIMEEKIIGGQRVWIHGGVEMFNVAAFNMNLVSGIGGFHQPNGYYGGIEISLYHSWIQKGMKLVYLRDHTSEAAPVDREDPSMFDKSYGKWKIAHATEGFVGSYEDWLIQAKENKSVLE